MSSNETPGIAPDELANLETIDFENLLSSNSAEQLKVLSVCENEGFFYLHLPQPRNQAFWAQSATLFALAKEVFDQPLQEKMKFHMALSGASEIAGCARIIQKLLVPCS